MALGSLASRHVVITGARRGIGRALAEVCAARGARLTLCARSEPPADLEAWPGDPVWRSLDVRDPASVEAWIGAGVAAHGPVHVLVNNAAVLGPRLPLASYPLDAWREVMDVNVDGAFFVTRAVLPHLVRPGAVALFLSSYLGRHALPRYGAYCASKFAVEGLAALVAEEHRQEGIVSCSLSPGMVQSDMLRLALEQEDVSDHTPAPAAARAIVRRIEELELADSGAQLTL